MCVFITCGICVRPYPFVARRLLQHKWARAVATRHGPVAMYVIEAHMGPEPLEDGVVFLTHIAGRIFRETGVRANYRARKQFGRGENCSYRVPPMSWRGRCNSSIATAAKGFKRATLQIEGCARNPTGGRMRANTLCTTTETIGGNSMLAHNGHTQGLSVQKWRWGQRVLGLLQKHG